MSQTFIAFLVATGAVTLAEMGDKTQLLAMAFACKFKASKVLTGVFLATLINHALAVAAGNLIAHYSILDVWIQGVASLSFILFGLWTIRGDKLEGETGGKTRFGTVITVAIAFFIAELGDKTQLATFALAAKYPANPIGILAGTTTGMLIADTIGIIVGVIMCKKIPERTIKLISAGVFILFGIVGSYQVAVGKLNLQQGLIAVILGAITVLTVIAAWYIYRKNEVRQEKRQAACSYCGVKDENILHGTE